MMSTQLYWHNGFWPGRLGLSARPRGGDWLEEEMAGWRRAGTDVVLSLLTPQENTDLDLDSEQNEASAQGMEFWSFPIADRDVPGSEAPLASLLERIDHALSRGRNVVLHCRQGVGRTGLLAACLLVSKGIAPEFAVAALSAARGVPIPETPEQRRWIDRFAALSTPQD